MSLRFASVLATLLVCPPALAQAPDDLASFVNAGGEGALVLTHTDVRATIEAGLAVVDVVQSFQNPFEEPIDATYLFPLPPDAAVRAMSMTCGGRRIDGEVLSKARARERYEAAAAEGRKAALLEQHRPNLFQQSVASICPGEAVTVALQYVDPLVQEDGVYTLVFPTTVGPRYRPGDVPEPPFTTLPTRSVSVEVVIAEGMPVETLFSDSHPIEVLSEDPESTRVRIADGATLPNADFQLSWSLAGGTPRLAALALPPTDDEDGYLAVTLEPQVLEDLVQPRGRELLFVLDASCSMRGAPWEAASDTVRLALKEMRPDDTFNLVRFSNVAGSLFSEPKPADAANVAAAERWLAGAFVGGGTEMSAGIVHSLDMPGDPERLRLVLMLTDGYIGNDQQILDTVTGHLGEARLFSLGVGASVNRYLLDRLAGVGRGDVSYQLPGTPIEETVSAFYDRIAHPAMTDLSIDWGGLQVTEVYPSRIPDLFAGQPVRVVARYHGAAEDTVIRLHGRGSDESYTLSRPLSVRDAEGHEALPVLWARRKIADLTLTLAHEPARLEEEGAAVALAHHLVSPWTSLVATEKTRSSCGPATLEAEVPSLLPAGVDPGVVGSSGVLGGLIGTTSGSAGLGGLGTRGIGSGGGGYGTSGGVFGAKGEGGLGAVGGDPIVLGSLPRNLIDEVIKRHMNQVKYCYQRELQNQPTLGGKVVVKFTIAADGTVAAASIQSSTLGSEPVESCLLGRFHRMAFPAPPGGGIVIVSYPFVFSPQ